MINAILYVILGVTYLIVYPMKIKNKKITFISYKSDKVERDFKLISNELKKRDQYELVYILLKYKKTLLGDLKYLINCIVQVYHINTSQVVILDYNNYVVSNFKKSEVKVLQVWHASGAIKKFGNDVNRKYKIKNYDYILATSDIWKKPYSSAFNVREDQVLPLGIPKNDNLFSNKIIKKYQKLMYEKFPLIKGKKVILYAPTFRGDHLKHTTYEKIDLKYIQDQLGEEYIIMYKLHPLLVDVSLCDDPRVINVNRESIAKLFSVTDYLITDYSSILFDFTIFNKPIISYVPDIESYREKVGLYIDYERHIPAPICKTEYEIVDAIKKKNFKLDEIEKFKEKYFKYQDGKATQRVVDFIENIIA